MSLDKEKKRRLRNELTFVRYDGNGKNRESFTEIDSESRRPTRYNKLYMTGIGESFYVTTNGLDSANEKSNHLLMP